MRLGRLTTISTIVVVIAGSGIGGWIWYSHHAGQPKYAIAIARKAEIQDTVSALGVLEPSQYVDVGSQVEGQLTKLTVGLGDTVKQGQLVAQVDPVAYAAKVGEDKAEIADLKAQSQMWIAKRDLAQWTYTHNQQLVEKGAATAQALEQSQSDLKSAQATLTSISAQIEKTEQTLVSDQADLNHTAITAPISGLVISPTSSVYGTTWTKQDIAHQGQILNNKSNAPILLRLANLDNMIIRAQVSEADVAKLHTGMPTYFTTLGRPNRRVSGKLDTIEPTPELINGAIFYDALFQVANPDHKLLPQMTAQVFFVVGQASDAVTVPITALASSQRQSGVVLAGCPSTAANTQTAHAHQHARNEQGPVATTTLDCVFVLDNGKPLAREVTVGIKNEVDAQITSGLDAGTQVIVGVPAAQHEPNRGNGQGRKQ